MDEAVSDITDNKLYKELTSDNATIVLSRLNEIDSLNSISPDVFEILKLAYKNEKKLIIKFLIKKSLRFAIGKSKKIDLNIDLNLFESLLKDQSRIDDLALAIISIDSETASLVAEKLRTVKWQKFSTEILPVFCRFFKQYGNFKDINSLLDLTKHINPVVVIAAIDALETIDPTKLQGIVEPLLSSKSIDMRLQVIQVYYKWNKKDAIDKYAEILFSENTKDKSLAIFHSNFFRFSDIESLLIQIIPNIDNKYDLINLMQVFVKNAYIDLPLKIFLANRHLKGEQQNLVKGLMLGVIRELNRKSIIQCSIQDFLIEIKERAKCIINEKDSNKSSEIETDKVSDVVESSENSDEALISNASKNDNQVQELNIVNEEDSNEIKNFEGLSEKRKIRFLTEINQDYFAKNYKKLKEYYQNSKDKVLASFIKLFGRYGDEKETDDIRRYCSSNNPDVICACIKALSRLDVDYLCLYLPTYLQNSNGKVRMTAVRICSKINIEQVKSLLLDMMTSENTSQRTIGVSISLLVDFNIVREPLITALEKENNSNIIRKICDVLAANPDKEILYRVYKFSKTNKRIQPDLMQDILKTISEKLAVKLNQSQSPERLIKEAETAFTNEMTLKRLQNLNSFDEQRQVNIKSQKSNVYDEIDDIINTKKTLSQTTQIKQQEASVETNSTISTLLNIVENVTSCIAFAGLLFTISGVTLGIINILGSARIPAWLAILVIIARVIFDGNAKICAISGMAMLFFGGIIAFFSACFNQNRSGNIIIMLIESLKSDQNDEG